MNNNETYETILLRSGMESVHLYQGESLEDAMKAAEVLVDAIHDKTHTVTKTLEGVWQAKSIYNDGLATIVVRATL